ncbi:ribosome recycling factor [bacterium]|nr:ribosome recycling factor [bacterium]
MKDKIISETRDKMQRAVDGIRHEFSSLRTGKAAPALLESIQVEAYGARMPISQLGTVSAPEPRLLVVQPWDKTMVGAIQKAILASDLGLTPGSDGNVIRVPIPALTEERRKDLVKFAHKIAETGRVSIRHHRKEANDELKKQEKDKVLSEDVVRRAEAEVQKLTDDFIEKLEAVLKAKEAEIMEV